MDKFIKKPVAIEAIQLTRENIREVYSIVYSEPITDSAIAEDKWQDYCYIVSKEGMTIPTLEDGKDKRAKHVADIGDWIIKGIKGEFYPCKPDIFEQTYYTEQQYAELNSQ